MDTGQFERVIEEGRALQGRLVQFGPVVAVGDTAAALHCQHRFSVAVDVVTPLLRGRFTEDWKRLYALCQDRGIAIEVASVLRFRDPGLLAPARLWKFLLEDLHPGLRVEWDEHRRDIGV